MKKKCNISVRPRRRETAERMIKRFIKKCKKDGILQEVRDRRYYRKPSEIKRLKKAKRKRDIAKANKKEKRNR